MKELSIEEKAKAYDEAKARMSIAYNSNRCTIGFMNEIFPELVESENDKIRKKIIAVIDACLNIRPQLIEEVDYLQIKAWLEKQDDQKSTDIKTTGYWNVQDVEQKPAWSKEDENRFKNLVYLVEQSNENKATKEGFIKFINKLKYFK